MSLEIQLYGSPILRQPGAPVVNFDPWLKQFANDLVTILHKVNAIGLAAHHVGLAIQLCAIDIRTSSKNLNKKPIVVLDNQEIPLNLLMPLIIVNPKLTPLAGKQITQLEGSVSFPDISVPITRPQSIHLQYQDLHGNAHELECNDLLARCISHEYDQLQGILFIDKAHQRDLIPYKAKLNKIKNNCKKLIKNN